MNATPPIEVDSEIIRELILFVRDALTTILTIISTIDDLIASLPSDSSPTTPWVSGDDRQMTDSLKHLRDTCELFVNNSWLFFIRVTFQIADPNTSSFQTIILDDPSFPDLFLNSLKLTNKDIKLNAVTAIKNIVVLSERMKSKFMTANLVGRMFETVDFVCLPLSESRTLFELTNFLADMFFPIGDDEEVWFQQYSLIRVSVFEPAKYILTFLFNNWEKLILDEEGKWTIEKHLCFIQFNLTNMELRSDEHDADTVSELMKWEMRTTVETENEEHFEITFFSMLNRTHEWKRNKRERQKRREVLLREEGWDDVFELRVVGMKVNSRQTGQDLTADFRVEQTFNADEL
ncbi:hypothetical protein BLNAU_18583 [Blattamonas nauphoetae]|uniref:Uncharacterized protein n=1 Tax=Blattamonas nauphoetae TaxID=2049346 RepID=A0ABQ9X3W0_9EUKA|nr:hypothetical protein BLNAU_18583 [Blattamonas nauphoetae]